ncbi:phage tail assembly protein [Cohaesibacter marisflavi]|uniref:phage tail assembly protein n=1 Tax=Cohaesibacter marisflavi TaxID=655353 RepID=UPI0029C6D8B9|nr:phage tail assembly protein [Cohaesibacter marisflavi]
MAEKQGVTIDLVYPVTVGGRTISQLNFRRMKVGDTLVAEDETDEQKAGIALFARLAGVDPVVIEELDLDDFEQITKAAPKIMGKSAAAAMDQQMKASSQSAGET